MKATQQRATLVALVLAVCALSYRAEAQQPRQPADANAERYGIGVIDVAYIFKHHGRFNAMMEQMKQQVEQADKALQDERRRIGQLSEQLKQYEAGSPDYKRLEEDIAKKKAEFSLKANKQRKDFMEQEAKIYYQTYLELNDAVKYYAQRKKLGLVLKFNGEPIDPNKREDVLRGINKPVVYQNGIDITGEVLSSLNRGGGNAQAQPGNRVGRPTIPGQPLQR